ncbi:MAG: phage terminase large subunit family protein [Planctomycetota bacterium]
MGAEITSAELAASDPAWWATKHNRIQLQSGIFSFDRREYLLEPMRWKYDYKRPNDKYNCPAQCLMKGAQGGVSTTVLLSSLHGMIFKRFPLGVLYLFPSTEAVHEFSRATLSSLIADNRSSIGRHIKANKSGTDTTSLKKVNGANMYMRGAGLHQRIEGEGASDKLVGISVDRDVFDEVGMMDLKAIEKAQARMGASDVKEQVYIGNPLYPNHGIDAIFQESDQRFWFRKCRNCGRKPERDKYGHILSGWEWFIDIQNGWTSSCLSFPDGIKHRDDGSGYTSCLHCGTEIFTGDGVWVPHYPEQSHKMHGYQYSQLCTPTNDPADILEAYTNPPNDNLADVYRLRLGRPWVSSEEKLTMQQVMECCERARFMKTEDDGPCAFGLDIGKVKHLVIGKRTGDRSFEIVKMMRLSSWPEIEALIDRFNCTCGVVDARPYEDAALQFKKEMRHMRIFLCEYSDSAPAEPKYDTKHGYVKCNRTAIFDETHSLVATKGRLRLPDPIIPEVSEFATQVCDPTKVKETDRKNNLIFRYRKRKADHYRHALNYFLLAAGRIGIAPKELLPAGRRPDRNCPKRVKAQAQGSRPA